MKRIGVLIGPNGSTKARIEKETGVKILVDSETGEVTIDESNAPDPMSGLKVRDLVKAIGRGFSEEKAFKLLRDDVYLKVIDIRDFAGKSAKRVRQIKGRLIGKQGKTRGIIEDLTGVSMSVYGHTVSLIGDIVELEVASRAVEMVLKGSEHSTVYRFLERMRSEMKLAEIDMQTF